MSADKTAAARITAARVRRWLNTETLKPMFGVQVRSGGRWVHLAIGGKAALSDDEAYAQSQADEIMQQVKQ